MQRELYNMLDIQSIDPRFHDLGSSYQLTDGCAWTQFWQHCPINARCVLKMSSSDPDSLSFDVIDLEKGASILETQPSTIVLVVMFFLVVSIGTERVS